MSKRKLLKYTLYTILILFVFINIIAYSNAYKFTHFQSDLSEKPDIENANLIEKTQFLLLGLDIPKPQNRIKPTLSHKTFTLSSNDQNLECWYIPNDSADTTVILFHGYAGSKQDMLDRAYIFHEMGYNTLLVDFMGCGGSDGEQTTIGYYESINVRDVYNYTKLHYGKNIILTGTSMGAAAILKAEHDYSLNPLAMILECPYSTMLKTVALRFEIVNLPSFPMAQMLTFWGGIQNKFNAFEMKPVNFAKSVTCPTLLIYGEKDTKVTKDETLDIFNNLNSEKRLKIYPSSSHADYLLNDKEAWEKDVRTFLQTRI